MKSIAIEALSYMDAKETISNVNRSKIKIVYDSKKIKEEKNEEMKIDRNTLKKREDGRWEVRKTIDGVRRSFYGKTQKECIANYKSALSEKKKSQDKHVYKFFDLIYEFLKSLEGNPYITYESASRIHIYPNFKDKPINKITEDDVIKLLGKINTDRNRIKVYTVLDKTFKIALRRKLIKESPMQYIERPKAKQKKGKALTKQEENEFLKKIINHKYEDLFLFYLYSGCRRSEAITITISDIDYDNNTICIHGTKTKTSDRIIPLFPNLKKIIIKLQIRNKLLFDNINVDKVSENFKELVNNHTLHDLRHTFATRALEKGIPMKVVQSWLGHSSYSTTADIYSHVLDETSQKYAKMLEFDPNSDPKN